MKKHLEHLSKEFKSRGISDVNELLLIRQKNRKLFRCNYKPYSYALYHLSKTDKEFMFWLEPKEVDVLRDLGVNE